MDLIAFAHLRKFVLHLASYINGNEDEEGSTSELFDNVEGLPVLLNAMRHLTHLDLSLSEDNSN